MTKFERRIEFSQAYDKRHPNPKKNYGIHGLEMRFYLIGKEGAMQFVIFTNWMLPHVEMKHHENWCPNKPMAADVGYHSRKEMYKDQTVMTGDCPIIGGPCYYDGSGLMAEDVFKIFVAHGSEGMWKDLERRYKTTFND